MKIHSNDIPQADVLEDVVKTVMAVSKGAKTFQEISQSIGKVDRQGRYYRRAAEILGFIRNEGNQSMLTEPGKELLNSSDNLRSSILARSILNVRIFQRLIAFLETNKEGVKKENLIEYLGGVTEEIGKSMLPRRASTLVAWLKSLGVVSENDHKIFVSSDINKQIPILDFNDVDEPILPHSGNLSEYQIVEERSNKARDSIVIYKDQAKLDRSDNTHIHLVNMVANRISSKGYLPKSNQLIDLAAKVEEKDFIFEMKSITEENAKSQIRKGVSQLYEYRYLQNAPTAGLVLAIETKLPVKIEWMYDYLESDREIMLLWDGDESLYSTSKTKSELNFLW